MGSKKLIRITAESTCLSSNEVVGEDKAVKRLTEIRNHFKYLQAKHGLSGKEHALKVSIAIVNPTIF